jgi:hypothetical protein
METQAELWLEIAWATAKFLNGFYDRKGEVATPQLELVTRTESEIRAVSLLNAIRSITNRCV